MDPAPVLAERGRDDIDEGGDVVVGGPLALAHRLDRERGALATRRGSRRRHPALGSPGIGGGKLDLEPALQPPLVAPDRSDLGSRVAIDHALMMRAASKPAFLAPSIATHATGTPGGHLHGGEQRVEAAEALAEDRDPDHRQVGVRRGDPGEGGGHPGAGDQHPQPPHPGRVAVLAHLLGISVRAHHPHLVADPRLLQGLAGRLHFRLVVLRAEDDPDPGRVDLDLLERGLDLGHRLGGAAAGGSISASALGVGSWISTLLLRFSSLPPGPRRPARRCQCASACRRTRSARRRRRRGRGPRRASARARSRSAPARRR